MTDGTIVVRKFAVAELVFRPEFRRYCEQNLCGKFGRHPQCPPLSGTVDEMRERVRRFQTGVLLCTHGNPAEHNRLASEWIAGQIAAGTLPAVGLLLSAGPTEQASCMSAYCIDAGELMKTVGLPFSWKAGEESYLTLYVY